MAPQVLPWLLCPHCQKSQDKLSAHLHQVCMKSSTDSIPAVVQQAKMNAQGILKSGIFFSYDLLERITNDSDPCSRLIEELQCRHMVVTDVTGRPSASTARQPPAVEETSDSEQCTDRGPHDCLALLRAAKMDFLSILSKVNKGDGTDLSQSDCSLLVYYLEAVVMLKHLQQPSIVQHLTVSNTIVVSTFSKFDHYSFLMILLI